MSRLNKFISCATATTCSLAITVIILFLFKFFSDVRRRRFFVNEYLFKIKTKKNYKKKKINNIQTAGTSLCWIVRRFRRRGASCALPEESKSLLKKKITKRNQNDRKL